MITPYQKHLRDIDIPAWERGAGDWFTIRLFGLMGHADGGNMSRLASVFPEEAEAYRWWFDGKKDEPDPDAFDPRDDNSPGVW
jgi:hypothetical protein